MKIKTAALLTFSFFAAALLCGCTANRELDEQSLVCTLCFSGEEELTVTVEVLTENTEEKKLLSKLHTARGETPEKAVKELKNQMPKRPLFDHCAAIVLSPETSKERQKQILAFCVREPTINLGTPVVYSKNERALFACRPEAAGIGYDIMLTLKQLSCESDSRLYKTALTLENIKRFENVDGALMKID